MKKVMIGVLILIPVIILLVIAAVSNIVSIAAAIGVEEVNIYDRDSIDPNDPDAKKIMEFKTLQFDDISNEIQNIYNWIDVEVLPKKANSYSIEFSLSDVVCTDDEYEGEAVYMVDIWKNNKKVKSNTTGDISINSYCYFTVNVKVETFVKSFNVQVIGYDVNRIKLKYGDKDDASINVGDSILLSPSYNPIDSIIKETTWISDNPTVAKVDKNGAVTGLTQGVANITMKTHKYSNNAEVISSTFTVNVTNGYSSLYGKTIYLSKNNTTFDEIGLIGGVDSYEGCTILDSNITLTSNSATITKDGKTITINKVEIDDITIENASVYDVDSEYVLEVSEYLKLYLSVKYLDSLNNAIIDNATWTSSNETIATVDNGVVTPKSSGLVTISVSFGGKSSSINLNVQNKVSMLTLSTNNEYLGVGLAEETVFASEKYNSDFTKSANSTIIKIDGEPENATEEELKIFYSAYSFEVVGTEEQKSYAAFSNPDKANELVFTNALEGKSKQNITVRVSAKYPKYVSMTKFTVVDITVNAIYGVEVSNIYELKKASIEQKSYAEKEDNLVPNQEFDERVTSPRGDVYIFANASYGKNMYAICLSENCVYTEEYNISNFNSTPDSELKQKCENANTINEINKIQLLGDLYGNGYMISAASNVNAEEDNALIDISMSNITVSNVTLRAQPLESDTISKSETSELDGTCIEVFRNDDYYSFNRMFNINVEYSIIENAYRAMDMFNSDVTVTGCVFRNISSCALYEPMRIRTNEDTKLEPYASIENAVCVCYSNLVTKDCVISNSLASFLIISSECINIMPGSEYRFAETEEESLKFFKEYFMDKGYNGSYSQKGFLDMYNWNTTDSMDLITTYIDSVDQVVHSSTKALVDEDPTFEPIRVLGDNGYTYMMMGVMIHGVDGGSMTFNDPMLMDISFEDDRFYGIDLRDLEAGDNVSGEALIGYTLIDLLDISFKLYFYRNDADIQPGDTFTIDNTFIDKLHGRTSED